MTISWLLILVVVFYLLFFLWKSNVPNSINDKEIQDKLHIWESLLRALDNIPMSASDTFPELKALSKVAIYFERVDNPKLTITILGEFSSGKSSFINSLLGEKVLATKIRPTTATITKLTYGETPRAIIHYDDGTVKNVDIINMKDDICNLTAMGSKTMSESELKRVSYVELQLNYPLLHSFDIVDTPGFNSGNEWHTEATKEIIGNSDVIFWVFSANKAGARTEIELLENQTKAQQHRIAIINQVDLISEASDREESYKRILQEIPIYLFEKAFFISSKQPKDGVDRRDYEEIAHLKKFLLDEIVPRSREYHCDHFGNQMQVLKNQIASIQGDIDKNIRQEQNIVLPKRVKLDQMKSFCQRVDDGQSLWNAHQQKNEGFILQHVEEYFDESMLDEGIKRAVHQFLDRQREMDCSEKQLKIREGDNLKLREDLQNQNNHYLELKRKYDDSLLSNIADKICNFVTNTNFTDAKDELDAVECQVNKTKGNLERLEMEYKNDLDRYKSEVRILKDIGNRFIQQNIATAMKRQLNEARKTKADMITLQQQVGQAEVRINRFTATMDYINTILCPAIDAVLSLQYSSIRPQMEQSFVCDRDR